MKTYATKVECETEDNEVVFTLETFDNKSADLEVKQLLTKENISDVLVQIKKAFDMLELEE